MDTWLDAENRYVISSRWIRANAGLCRDLDRFLISSYIRLMYIPNDKPHRLAEKKGIRMITITGDVKAHGVRFNVCSYDG